MGFITDLPLTTMTSLGIVCLVITITVCIMALSTPKNTPTRETYDNLSSFSLYIILPTAFGFFILAFAYWTYMTQSVKNVGVAAKKARGATTQRVATTRALSGVNPQK